MAANEFFQMGYESGMAGAARAPFFDERIKNIMEMEPCEIGSKQNKNHNRMMVEWTRGYDAAICEQLMAV